MVKLFSSRVISSLYVRNLHNVSSFFFKEVIDECYQDMFKLFSRVTVCELFVSYMLVISFMFHPFIFPEVICKPYQEKWAFFLEVTGTCLNRFYGKLLKSFMC